MDKKKINARKTQKILSFKNYSLDNYLKENLAELNATQLFDKQTVEELILKILNDLEIPVDDVKIFTIEERLKN